MKQLCPLSARFRAENEYIAAKLGVLFLKLVSGLAVEGNFGRGRIAALNAAQTGKRMGCKRFPYIFPSFSALYFSFYGGEERAVLCKSARIARYLIVLCKIRKRRIEYCAEMHTNLFYIFQNTFAELGICKIIAAFRQLARIERKSFFEKCCAGKLIVYA